VSINRFSSWLVMGPETNLLSALICQLKASVFGMPPLNWSSPRSGFYFSLTRTIL